MPDAAEQFKDELKKAAKRLEGGLAYTNKARSWMLAYKDTSLSATSSTVHKLLQKYEQARARLMDATDPGQFATAYKEWETTVKDLLKAQAKLAAEYKKEATSASFRKKVKAQFLPKSISFDDLDREIDAIKKTAANVLKMVSAKQAAPPAAAAAPGRPATPAPAAGATWAAASARRPSAPTGAPAAGAARTRPAGRPASPGAR